MAVPHFLRFTDLQARGIVKSRPALKKKIDNFGFPPGRLLGPNSRAWTDDEVEAWINQQPTARKPAPRRSDAEA